MEKKKAQRLEKKQFGQGSCVPKLKENPPARGRFAGIKSAS